MSFHLDDRNEDGKLRRQYPPGYDFAVSATQVFLNHFENGEHGEMPEIINAPEKMRLYYQSLYALSGRSEGQNEDEAELLDAIRATQFPDVAKHYRLIQQDVINVIVPFDQEAFNRLVEEANESGELSPAQVRRFVKMARVHSVSLYRPNADDDVFTRLLPLHFGTGDRENAGLETSQCEWWYPASDESYDSLIGLQLAEPQWIM